MTFSIARLLPAYFVGRLAEILAQDLFTTDRAAGAINGTPAEPGPGTRVVIDTGNLLTISGGKLTFSSAVPPGNGNPGSWLGAYTRQCGLAMICQLTIGSTVTRFDAGFDTNQDSASNLCFFVAGGGEFRAQAVNQYAAIGTYAIGTYFLATVLRDMGQWYLVKGGVYTDWTLLMVDNVRTDTPVYPAIGVRSTNGGVLTVDSLQIAKLNGPWSTQYGPATQRVANAGVGEIITAEANAIIEATITAATGITQELSVRRTNDDNRYIVRMDQAGSTIKLIREEGGVETELSSVAQTWTNGTQYRIIVQLAGSSIKTWVGFTIKNNVTAQTFNQAATGVKISHAASDLIACPYTQSSEAAEALDLAIA